MAAVEEGKLRDWVGAQSTVDILREMRCRCGEFIIIIMIMGCRGGRGADEEIRAKEGTALSMNLMRRELHIT